MPLPLPRIDRDAVRPGVRGDEILVAVPVEIASRHTTLSTPRGYCKWSDEWAMCLTDDDADSVAVTVSGCEIHNTIAVRV